MTAAAEPGSRPAKPRGSLAIPIGLVVFLVITWASLSEEFGIGLDLGALADSITRGAGILGELASPNWAFVADTLPFMLETFQMAIVAAVIGCGVALPVAFLLSRVASRCRWPSCSRGSRLRTCRRSSPADRCSASCARSPTSSTR
jgi:phosphonate transport system permease protein